MSEIRANLITDAAGTGAPSLPNGLSVADGTRLAPSITNIGDLNTGIYFPAADTVGISTAGGLNFVVGPSGEVGFGGTNYGTAGQVLTSGGSSVAPSWLPIPAPTSAQVGTATAGLAYGDVGTYAYLNINTTSNLSEGSTFSGSSLSPAGSYVVNSMVAGTGQTSGAIRGAATLSGTWRLMGSNNIGATASGKQNVYLRIS